MRFFKSCGTVIVVREKLLFFFMCFRMGNRLGPALKFGRLFRGHS